MVKLGKSVKTSSKKSFKESPEITEKEVEKVVNLKSVQVAESSDEDDAPEAISMSTSKSQIISQIKSEREARRMDREKKRQKAVSLQEQQRQARERKTKEIEAVEDEISEDNESEKDEPQINDLFPLPENILESAITQQQNNNQQQKRQIRFESSEEDESDLPVSNEEILETVRLHRAKATKRRLVDSLPYSVVEVGVNGKFIISKAEIKARRAISKLKMQSAGSDVRRIDAVLDRARKNRTASAVFYRNNSFY